MKPFRAFGVLIFLLCASGLFAKDWLDSQMEVRVEGGAQNPLIGYRGELSLLCRPLNLEILAGLGWGFFPELPSPKPLFGGDGYQAKALVAYMFSGDLDKDRYPRSRGECKSNWIELAALMEPTGIYRLGGYKPETMEEVYVIDQGASLFINPRYRARFSYGDIWGSGLATDAEVNFAIGPIFTPDMSLCGAIIESYVGFDTRGWKFYTSVQLGLALRTNAGSGLWLLDDSDGEQDYLYLDNLAFIGYMPMRINIGFGYALQMHGGR